MACTPAKLSLNKGNISGDDDDCNDNGVLQVCSSTTRRVVFSLLFVVFGNVGKHVLLYLMYDLNADSKGLELAVRIRGKVIRSLASLGQSKPSVTQSCPHNGGICKERLTVTFSSNISPKALILMVRLSGLFLKECVRGTSSFSALFFPAPLVFLIFLLFERRVEGESWYLVYMPDTFLLMLTIFILYSKINTGTFQFSNY